MDSANELLTFQPASQNDIAVNGVLLSSMTSRAKLKQQVQQSTKPVR